jgi:glycine/D-amino acid oxidase-like deaminating enzyme
MPERVHVSRRSSACIRGWNWARVFDALARSSIQTGLLIGSRPNEFPINIFPHASLHRAFPVQSSSAQPSRRSRRKVIDLYSGNPWWVAKSGLLRSYPALHENTDCDVLIVGAGITGALIADTLSGAGMRVCVIDRREAGWGSTSASTALLQKEIDTEMQDLATMVGIDDAVLAYRACEKAVLQLGKLAGKMRGVEFRRMHSLYFASRSRDEKHVRDEGRLRQQHGFDLKILEPSVLRKQFGIDAPAALLTPVAAEIDPYQLAHALLTRVRRRGGSIHGRTELTAFEPGRGGVHAHTADGRSIRCQHLIFASGYESQLHLDQRVARNRSSYALVSEPVIEGMDCLRKTLVWESARPYLYLRTTHDDRIIVGGLDDSIDIAIKRDASVEKKSAALIDRMQSLFPRMPLKPAFSWAGTFAETEDGLPFFGPHPQHGARVHFAMAYGGNGITYSMIGAEILLDSLQGRKHPCADLFSFRRLAR